MRKIALLTMVLATLYFSNCGRPGNDEIITEEEIGTAVRVQLVREREMPLSLGIRGNVRPWEQAMIAGATGVRISNIMVEPGDRVSQGQTLVRMSDEQLEQARIRLELAETELERLDTLLNIGAISRQQFDQAQSEHQNALSNYRMMRQNIELTAPFAGTITERHFNAGEVFTPSAQTPAIVTLMQLHPIKVVVHFSEEHFGRLQEGMPAHVSVDHYPDTVFVGQVHRVFPAISEVTRTFQTEIRVENPQHMLRPGMYARVSIQLDEITGLFVPISAVQRQPGTANEFVFTVENDTAYRVPVETGSRSDEWVLITSGISEGETIVTEGMAKLGDESLVRVMEVEGEDGGWQ
jgi:membrane fusion protein, multidrug efflux system